jgi:hypothetical protein
MNISVETIVTDTFMTDILVERQDTNTTNKNNGIIAYENTNVQNENTEMKRSLSADKENETQNPEKFSAILTIPQNAKVKPNSPKLPKAISGKEMIKFLEDRKNKKEEEVDRESQKRKIAIARTEMERNEIRI